MILLAIDTAQDACSVALRRGDEVVERRREMRRGHAEAVLPMLRDLLAESGCRFADLGALAVTIGPGAFTGLRIGLACARGLVLATGLPCFGVTTTEAVAESLDWARLGDRPVAVVLDSRSGDLYVQPFAAGWASGTIDAASPEVVAARFAGRAAVAVAGDGAPRLLPALAAVGVEAEAIEGGLSAAAVARLAGRRWDSGDRPSSPPDPLYVRAPATGPRLDAAAEAKA